MIADIFGLAETYGYGSPGYIDTVLNTTIEGSSYPSLH